MEKIYDTVKTVFEWIVQYGIVVIELVGVAVLMCAVIKTVVMIFKREDRYRIYLAKGISLSLEFKMGSELLRTLIIREWSELLVLGGVILLRVAMTIFIEWEIKKEHENEVLTNNK